MTMLVVLMVFALIFLDKGNQFAGARSLVEEWPRYNRSAVEHTYGSIRGGQQIYKKGDNNLEYNRSAAEHTRGSKRGGEQVYNKDDNSLEYNEINEQAIRSRLDTELGTKLPLDPASAREVENQLTSLTLQQSLENKKALEDNMANAARQFTMGMQPGQNMQTGPGMQTGQVMQRGQSLHSPVNMQFANLMSVKSQRMSSSVDGTASDAAKSNSENQLNSERLMTSEAMGQFNDGFPENGKPQTQSHPTLSMQLNDVMGPNATPVQALGNLVAPPMPPTTRVVEQDANGLLKPFNVGYDGVGKPVGQMRQEFFSHGITRNVLNRMMFGGMRDVIVAGKQGALFARSTAHKNERSKKVRKLKCKQLDEPM